MLFVHKLNMTLATSGMLEVVAKCQYLRTLFRGEALHRFYLLYADVEGEKNLNVDYIIRGLAQ